MSFPTKTNFNHLDQGKKAWKKTMPNHNHHHAGDDFAQEYVKAVGGTAKRRREFFGTFANSNVISDKQLYNERSKKDMKPSQLAPVKRTRRGPWLFEGNIFTNISQTWSDNSEFAQPAKWRMTLSGGFMLVWLTLGLLFIIGTDQGIFTLRQHFNTYFITRGQVPSEGNDVIDHIGTDHYGWMLGAHGIIQFLINGWYFLVFAGRGSAAKKYYRDHVQWYEEPYTLCLSWSNVLVFIALLTAVGVTDPILLMLAGTGWCVMFWTIFHTLPRNRKRVLEFLQKHRKVFTRSSVYKTAGNNLTSVSEHAQSYLNLAYHMMFGESSEQGLDNALGEEAATALVSDTNADHILAFEPKIILLSLIAAFWAYAIAGFTGPDQRFHDFVYAPISIFWFFVVFASHIYSWICRQESIIADHDDKGDKVPNRKLDPQYFPFWPAYSMFSQFVWNQILHNAMSALVVILFMAVSNDNHRFPYTSD